MRLFLLAKADHKTQIFEEVTTNEYTICCYVFTYWYKRSIWMPIQNRTTIMMITLIKPDTNGTNSFDSSSRRDTSGEEVL